MFLVQTAVVDGDQRINGRLAHSDPAILRLDSARAIKGVEGYLAFE